MTNMVVYGDKTANTLLFTVYNQNRRVKEDTEIHTFENESNLTRLIYDHKALPNIFIFFIMHKIHGYKEGVGRLSLTLD